MGLAIHNLARFPRKGIWALINPVDRKYYLSQSPTILEAMARAVGQIEDNTHPVRELIRDKEKLEFRVLDSCPESISRLLQLGYWKDRLDADGYTSYNKIKDLRYHPQIDFERINPTRSHIRAIVRLKNRMGKKQTVGIFKKMRDAQAFIRAYYTEPFYAITIAHNADTRKYLQESDEV